MLTPFHQVSFRTNIAAIAEEWQRNAVATGASYAPLPPQDELQQKLSTKTLTVKEYMAMNLPTLKSRRSIFWAEDTSGNFAAAKACLAYTRKWGWQMTGAQEKITSDLGHYHNLPVLPVQIWERPEERKSVFYSMTPLPFSHPRTGPPDERLANESTLPLIAIFDQWAKNTDRHREQIIDDPSAMPDQQNSIFYFDHEYTLSGRAETPSGVLRFKDAPLKPEMEISREVRMQAFSAMLASPEAERLIQNIENTPDCFIRDTVHQLPNALFDTLPDAPTATHRKQNMTDFLFARRDNLRTLIQKAIDLG